MRLIKMYFCIVFFFFPLYAYTMSASWYIPTYQSSFLSSSANGQNAEADEVCSICLASLSSQAIHSLSCEHTFHAECIFLWLKKLSRCPFCKAEVDEGIASQFVSDEWRHIPRKDLILYMVGIVVCAVSVAHCV